MRRCLPWLICLILALPVPLAANNLEEAYFSRSTNPRMTRQEKAGMELIEKWVSGDVEDVQPVVSADGSVQFLYGAHMPYIPCAIFQITDIELEPGEQITGLHAGDSQRWIIEPALSMAGGQEVQHIVVKPTGVGLQTTLFVTTNRRTYHIGLKAYRDKFFPRVSFLYPERYAAKWDKIQRQETEQRERRTIPTTGEYLGDLDFGYSIEGKARWKPVRVYSDGVKTVIEMPESMANTEAPTLLIQRGRDDLELVNYRLQGNRFIVDSVVDRAVLIAGVDSRQEKVTITRKGR